MNASTVLLDTNLLVYAQDRLSLHHKVAQRILRQAWKEEIKACVSLQNIAEFFAVVTDRKRFRTPLPAKEAYAIIDEYIQTEYIGKILENERTSAFLLYLIERYKPKRQEAHDVHLLALMLSCDVRVVYTADKGFKRFKEIKAINPFE